MIATDNLLGTVNVDGRQIDDSEGAGSRAITLVQPVNRPLRNDGIWRNWMQAGFTYDLYRGPQGWRVTSQQWTEREHAHRYQLAEGDDARLVDTLPTDDGLIRLETGTHYQLRQQTPGGPWGLYRA